jgi:hypothetical protein
MFRRGVIGVHKVAGVLRQAMNPAPTGVTRRGGGIVPRVIEIVFLIIVAGHLVACAEDTNKNLAKDPDAEVRVLSTMPASPKATATDIVPIRALNYPTLDCRGAIGEYDMKSLQVIYYDRVILCQLTLAYVRYSRKVPYY